MYIEERMIEMKYSWKKSEKEIYLPKRKPEIREIPSFQYLSITGKEDPNEEEFSNKVGALFALSYGIKMMYKRQEVSEDFLVYDVYPLEGNWSYSKESIERGSFTKDDLEYKIMIRQPNFITKEMVEENIQVVSKKKPNIYYEDIYFEKMEEGLSVQMMHHGSYDNEEETFKVMRDFMEENNLISRTNNHKEIYITVPSRAAEENQKVVLRYWVQKK